MWYLIPHTKKKTLFLLCCFLNARFHVIAKISSSICLTSINSEHFYSWYIFTVIPSPEARKNMMRLAQRMIRTFSLNISTSSGQSWTALPDSHDGTVRIISREITEPGQPNGVILSAVSTTWLPYPHFLVFDLLRDEHRRSQVLVDAIKKTLLYS